MLFSSDSVILVFGLRPRFLWTASSTTTRSACSIIWSFISSSLAGSFTVSILDSMFSTLKTVTSSFI